MEIFRHPACTVELKPPADMPEPACSPLPVVVTQDEDGIWSTSFWKPAPGELEVLAAGGTVALSVRATGRQHPVVAVGVTEAVEAV